MTFDPKKFLTKKGTSINLTMPLIYPESLVKIFQLKVGEIAADMLKHSSVHGRMDNRNALAAHPIRPLHHTVERSKNENKWL